MKSSSGIENHQKLRRRGARRQLCDFCLRDVQRRVQVTLKGLYERPESNKVSMKRKKVIVGKSRFKYSCLLLAEHGALTEITRLSA